MSANPSFGSDERKISEGTILGDHHMVESFLGEGGFGVVTRCRNTKNNQTVAIKVNKSDPEILQQAKQEIFILEQLQHLDPDRCNIVEWNGYFLDGERICLNFELLDQSLWDYIGDRNNQGLPIRELRPILHQLANALFHLGSVGIVHADLKPANIMVVNRHESPIKVKLIDFGIACNTSAVITGGTVGTIGYCAPEVMLGTPYDEAIDMWALGLVAVELATGVPLYPGEDDYDVLKFIIETQGQLPDHLLESGLYTNCYFIEDNYNEQRWTFKTKEQFQYETDYQSKETRYIKLKRLDDLEQLLKVRRGPENGQPLFVRLIKQMLALDANQRITPLEVLKHPFFNTGLSRNHLLESGLYTDCYFIEDNHYEQRWTFKTKEQFQYETNYQSKETRYIKLKRLDDLEQLLKVRRGPENGQPLFVRLIKQMLALDANQRIRPSEVLKHPFFNTGLSRSAPCTDMNSTGGENLVVSQQPSSWKSQGSQKFNCSFQNSVEYPQKGHVNTSANPSSSEDDLEISEGTILGDHHMVEAFLGEGGFGVVTSERWLKKKTVHSKFTPLCLHQGRLSRHNIPSFSLSCLSFFSPSFGNSDESSSRRHNGFSRARVHRNILISL
ncbi:NLR family CARD domain-containing protein 3 [Sarotherodon galilaeus]